MEEKRIEIKGNDGGKLCLIFPTDRFANRQNYLGEHALPVRIEGEFSGFRARFESAIYIGELRAWCADLERLYKDCEGEATLAAMEGFLDLKASADAYGHISFQGELSYPEGSEFTLRFEINSDQSYLPDLLHQFEAVSRFQEIGVS